MNNSYSNIEINYTEIPQEELNIDNKVRSNLFTWNGQFSPQFVEVILKKYGKPSDVILDPFLGSGTVLYEAARKGISAFGTELNISAYFMAKVYEIVNLNLDIRVGIVNEIDDLLTVIENEYDIVKTIKNYINMHKTKNVANLLSALIILLDIKDNQSTFEKLEKKWNELKDIVLCLPYTNKKIRVECGDARNILCKDDSATMLITSPPYINVFNYHQKYRQSVEALGYDVLSIAKKEFGSNRKNRGNRFLTVIQYCIDMALSICEASRICISGSRMIFVVGRESKVLGYSFCNSQLLYEICVEIFDIPFLLRQERVFKNRFGELIYEDILHFSNKKISPLLKEDVIISRARNIAVRMLKEKEKLYINTKNHSLIVSAIDKSNEVKESEK